ncbi:MAG: type VI secretion system contractile sheath small subunit [Ignavibacteriota bacterium]|jgi:type VI secretion system protein ImpB|nr:MAG: type VI secretion system contractile sheath small subunit [Ignavibacterium sp.]MBL1154057.1 type VI secretion system contractile sheath small subunit [Ignavibacteriota bacterium]MCO6446548.1 type VI secretion system contractile sheath small subunit [Ignavibacterium album]MCZ2268951.1 type VI secretion system contractile sheath small subunit [Ignavibacteriales bacterium]MDX9712217.1 type VI secretion system contractile sheath small subunit [Ignavibacteriaceae bacterium]
MARPTAPKIAQRVKVSILPSSDAKESVELDYRMMIPGNFSRSEPGSLGMIKDRRLRVIANKGDYQRVLKDINPKLKLTVNNKLSDDPESKMEVNLDFKEIKDFHPDEIVKKVEPLKQLLDARERLKQLKVAVLKDANLKKAIEGVLKDGSGSIDELLAKLGSSQDKEQKSN